MLQRWRSLLFLHWSVRPGRIQATLPPGLTVDTFADRAYIGLVPFTMRGVRPRGLPAVPGLSDFHEINVRTYVCGPDGVPGVWFYSLDAANPIAVRLARWLFALPYHHARMSLDIESTGCHRYRSKRSVPPDASSSIVWTPLGTPAPAEADSLEAFLCERYVLYALRARRLLRGRVYHSAYPLQPARLDSLDDSLCAAAGFSVEGPPEHVVAAAGVDVRIGALETLPGLY
jgi:uncharacterized protein YqjF (DUF2071 family)